ncbi:PREDICTED: structural maintenance of chromosomes protein 5 [Polistes dominula]|uniref:Structural maintenance of chromosomes protein 5 n=1 Tax=Polistes dominula TaxID=743375 RepID=A0ABM1IC26_POLDO|nr:PREDICTED: structural maintenance of chromosomes protein 5 [Polistes dominula]
MADNIIEKGIITRIYLENFVTYNQVVIKPGRNLNLIIGPNGTGKSTIVCAIVLGLGGKPNIIGRAVHVKDYVKSGCNEAKIEIQLKESHSKFVTITRTFNVSGKTCWFLNGQPTNYAAIQELTNSFNIQMDNLCQFLPQDKVHDFSKMNAQELLENTERSVGDPILLEYHMKLKDCRAEIKNIESKVVSKQRLLETKTQKYEHLKGIVSTIKEKKAIKKKILTLKQKKTWMLYDQKRKQLVEAKNERDLAENKVKSLQAKLMPINNMIKKTQSEINNQQSIINDYNKNKIIAKSSEANEVMNNILQVENEIKEAEEECSRRIQAEQNRDQDINLVQQQKSKLVNDLSLMIKDIGSEESLEIKQREISVCLEKQKRVNISLTNEITTYKQEHERIEREIRAVTEEQKSINIQAKRLEILRQRSPDSYKGVLWLRENQDKFRGKIYEPMLTLINVKDITYSKYLERIIALRDLIAFACENKDDMNLLTRYLREQQKLQVNIVHVNPEKRIYLNPNIPLQNIRRFGFEHYLASLFDAPSAIMKYLIPSYNLNNIPIGSRAVEENVEHIPHSLTCYFSHDHIYSVNMSKYTGQKSIKKIQISGNGILSIVLDTNKLQQMEKRLKMLIEKKEEILSRINEINETLTTENKKLDKYREDRTKYQQTMQQIQTLRNRISIVSQKIEKLENERTSKEDIIATYNKHIQDIVKKQLDKYKEYNSLLEDRWKYERIIEQAKLALHLYKMSLLNQENDIQDLKQELLEADKTFKELELQYRPLKQEAIKVFNEAKELTNGLSPQDEKFKPINQIFSKLPLTIEEIDKEIAVAQTKVFCMKQNVDAENIFREFEELEADIHNLQESTEREKLQVETITQNINKLREKWLPPLEKLVEHINMNFSSYFSEMKCAGEVALSHGDNVMDFDQYGLKIRVKFRDTDELQELTRHHQSGGERSLTTAIYMISLQELARVPFRCVDEINQGMDAINERRVFELLVKITGRPGSSQYFLLTPKLLPNLSYFETVTVHCVFNGPFMISSSEFDVEQYYRDIAQNVG